MKYEPDKVTKVLARISIVSVALFGAVIFYYLFRARLGMQIYPESFAWYTAAIKHNFSRSVPSRNKVLLFIDDAKKRELISTTKDILLYFDMTLQ